MNRIQVFALCILYLHVQAGLSGEAPKLEKSFTLNEDSDSTTPFGSWIEFDEGMSFVSVRYSSAKTVSIKTFNLEHERASSIRLKIPVLDFQSSAFAKKGNAVVCQENDELRLYSLDKRTDGVTLCVHEPTKAGEKPIRSLVRRSSDVLTSCVGYASSVSVIVTTIKEDRRIERFSIPVHESACMAVFESLILVGARKITDRSFNYPVSLWDYRKKECLLIREGHESQLLCCAFDKTGKRFATGGGDGRMIVWNAKSGKVEAMNMTEFSVSSVDFHPGEDRIAYSTYDKKGANNLFVYDVTHSRMVHAWSGDRGGVLTCRFSPDGKWLASVGVDGALKLWRTGE